MSPNLPPLDMHAHINPSISARELEGLGAVVFAATRSSHEFQQVMSRKDQVTIWGLGCHPGIADAQRAFDTTLFGDLLQHTAFVSEIGLDVKSAVPLKLQRKNLDAILDLVASHQRILSIHSYGATGAVLSALEDRPLHGVVLHWWLGSTRETEKAVDLGCYFSVNYAMTRAGAQRSLPLDRILFETDHPAGNRHSAVPPRPGGLTDVEDLMARDFELEPAEIRLRAWQTFSRMVEDTGVAELLPVPVRRMITAASNSN
ncbi:TatD family hydrolase [Jatrophihabitans sp. DSM 45814]